MDLGSSLPVPIQNITETIAMKLKWIEIQKQEKISKIVHLNQAIEDLKKGKMAEVEYALMKAQAELAEIERVETLVKGSIEA